MLLRVLVIIFECNNDILFYVYFELIKYVVVISINNYELIGKKGKIFEDVFIYNKCMLIRLLWNVFLERSKIYNRCLNDIWGLECFFWIFKFLFYIFYIN